MLLPLSLETMMLLNLLLLMLGFYLITKAADLLVESAAFIAKRQGVSPLIIGLTIIAFGTSAPEMMVSLSASLNDTPHIAIGNAIGSNIANIALVLGLTCLIQPIHIHSSIIKREYPLLFLVMGLVYFLIVDKQLSQIDGLILLGALALFLGFLIIQGQKKPHDSLQDEFSKEIKKVIKHPYILLIISLILLPLAAKLIVYAASFIAKKLGLSEATIGLTIVALGTSLPEIATSISGVLKKEEDIALGNIIGSNIFNLLAVLPLAALKKSIFIDANFINRDYGVMALLSLMLIITSYFKKTLPRLFGLSLLLAYSLYILWLLVE